MKHTAARPGSRRRTTVRTLALLAGAAAATVGTVLAVSMSPASAATVAGIDVSHYQGSINWTSVRNAGVEFAYIKATEGTGYKDPMFNTYYPAAYRAKVIRGSYHFALPDRSSGAAQANYFYNNGGAWSADNLTLPGALDMEYNPYGATCYGKTQAQMRTWIADFLNRYHALSGRYAVIYTSTYWWNTCTGSYSGFVSKHPLWVARYTSTPGTLPAGWSVWSSWQYTSTGKISGVSGYVDRDYWNGSRARLLALANNTP